MPTDAWAAVAAALPGEARWQRELPFWQALAVRYAWRRVADAGCGAGLHVALLASLGVDVVGFDLALQALATAPRGRVAVGDLLAPPLGAGVFDAVLCLGNTVSLLPSRAAQRRALAALAALLRPGGLLLLQGEDVGALVARGPVLRTRSLSDGGVHVRLFEGRGRRVRMLAAVAPARGQVALAETWLVPTGAADLTRLAATSGLRSASWPVAPPAGPGWWVALHRGGAGQ